LLPVLAYPAWVTAKTVPVEGVPADHGFINQVLDLLRARGGRATPARRLLLEVLVRSHGHRSAEELAAEVHAQAPEVNLTTIYRNLDELERLGIVDRTRLAHGPATFHLASAAHGHLACEQCGAMTEIPGEAFNQLAKAAERLQGFVIRPSHFAVSGRCVDCQ